MTSSHVRARIEANRQQALRTGSKPRALGNFSAATGTLWHRNYLQENCPNLPVFLIAERRDQVANLPVDLRTVVYRRGDFLSQQRRVPLTQTVNGYSNRARSGSVFSRQFGMWRSFLCGEKHFQVLKQVALSIGCVLSSQSLDHSFDDRQRPLLIEEHLRREVVSRFGCVISLAFLGIERKNGDLAAPSLRMLRAPLIDDEVLQRGQ